MTAPDFSTTGAPSDAPQMIPADAKWHLIKTEAGTVFELPPGDADFEIECSVDLPKVGYPTRIIIERVRFRPGVPENPTGRDSKLIPPGITVTTPGGAKAVGYVPWSWSQHQTYIAPEETISFRIHHNGAVPLPLAVSSVRGCSRAAAVADDLRVVTK